DEIVHRLGRAVETGREEEDRRAGSPRGQHVLELDRREGCLARTEDELALLLERDRGGALDQVLRQPGGDRAERPRGTRTDDVRVHLCGARRVWRAPVVRVVDGDAVERDGEARENLVA